MRSIRCPAGQLPHGLDVVEALEPGRRGREDAHRAGRDVAEVVDHADEEAAALVAPVLARAAGRGVAEGLEEDACSTWRARSAPGSPRRRGTRRRLARVLCTSSGELPEICVREADHVVRECSDDILRWYQRSLSGGTHSLRGRVALPCRRPPAGAAAARVSRSATAATNRGFQRYSVHAGVVRSCHPARVNTCVPAPESSREPASDVHVAALEQHQGRDEHHGRGRDQHEHAGRVEGLARAARRLRPSGRARRSGTAGPSRSSPRACSAGT